MQEDLKTLRVMVENILASVPETRNSDILLTKTIWVRYFKAEILTGKDGREYINIDSLWQLPREDHIKRIRAKIQNEDRLYLPTEKSVFLQRVKLSKAWKKFLGYSVFWNDAELEIAAYKYFENKDKPIQGMMV